MILRGFWKLGIDSSATLRYNYAKMDRTGKYYTAAEAARLLGVKPQTLRLWVRQGKIKALKTAGGRYRYPLSEIKRLLRGSPQDQGGTRAILYGRVSSADQKDDLERQVEFLREKAEEMGLQVRYVLTDIASGLNESRRGFRKLLDLALRGEVDYILVTYQDRLTRFGFKTLQRLLEGCGVEVISLLDSVDKDAKEELIEDLMAIITSFAGRVYGFRSHKIRQAKELLRR